MKNSFYVMALAALLPAAQAALSFPEAAAAKEQAKAENKPALILWYGPEWQYDAPVIETAWNKVAADGLPVVLGQVNDRLGQKWSDREKVLGVNPYNAPLGFLYAPDGTFIACYERPVAKDAAAVESSLKASMELMPAFMELVKQARDQKGPAAAEAAGKALEMLPLEDANRHKELKDLISKQDPDNTTGYKTMFCVDHMAMYNEIGKLLKGGPDGNLKGADQNFKAATEYVNKTLANPRLKPQQRQQWLAALAFLYREQFRATKDEAWKAKMLDCYNYMITLDADSEYGIGAKGYLLYWEKPDAK